MLLNNLVTLLNNELASTTISDYCPNGLQIEGKATVKKIVTGVTASLALIDEAIALRADAILVHHGYFWKGEKDALVGMKKARVKALLSNDISLLAYHLPLDIHPVLGNNAQLAKVLNIHNVRALEHIKPVGVVMAGQLPSATSHNEFSQSIATCLSRNIVSVGNNQKIRTVAWCTGGGQHFIDDVVEHYIEGHRIDAFISGEISEQTTHSAIEQNIDFFAAGHHATERYGIKALGEWLQTDHGIAVEFIDIDNPA